MRVQFEYKTVEGSNTIWYPDDITFFSNSEIVGGVHYADYSGNQQLTPASNEPQKPGVSKMSPLAFMNLIGDQLMVSLLNIAKTDPVVDLMIIKVSNAQVIDFEDEEKGPKEGLQYLLSKSYIAQGDYDRIMAREFL